MIFTTKMLTEKLNNYKNPQEKLGRLVKEGKVTPIIRGLYEDNKDTPGHLLANSICKPSYLSFEYALSYHGLIPEAVYTYTSATYNKRKKKFFETPFGIFSYRDVPKDVYPFDIKLINENGYSFLLASAEKALLDKIYTISPITSIKELEHFLFKELRIDENAFNNLNKKHLIELSKKYNNTSCRKLAIYLKEANYE